MFCTKCGASIPDGAKFCPTCGEAVVPSAEEKIPKKDSKPQVPAYLRSFHEEPEDVPFVKEYRHDAHSNPPVRAKHKSDNWVLAILIAVIALFAIAILFPREENNSADESKSIEYTEVTIDELQADCDANQAAAKQKWEGQYVTFSGYVSTIDADQEYVIIGKGTELFSYEIRCEVEQADVQKKLLELTDEQLVTVFGRLHDVGGLFYKYTLDTDWIG